MSVTVGVKKFTVSTKMLPFLGKSRFRNLGNFCWWNPESLKRLPLTKNPEPIIWNPNSKAWNPNSKTVLYFLLGGDKRPLISLCVIIVF